MGNRYDGITMLSKTADNAVFMRQCAIFENMRVDGRPFFTDAKTLIDVDGSIIQTYMGGGVDGSAKATVYEDYEVGSTYFKANFPITPEMIADEGER